MLALSIRQPYAELILRGEKVIEYRSRPTKRIGERFLIYAARPKTAQERAEIQRLVSGNGHETVRRRVGETVNGTPHNPLTGSPSHPITPLTPITVSTSLPTGVIVGTAVISECRRNHNGYEWHLTSVKRMKRPRKPKGRPQPVWFRPS